MARIIIEEEVKVTEGLVKVISQPYEIPDKMFCPKCGYFVEFKKFYNNNGAYRCLSQACSFELTSEDYVKQELAKAEQN